MRTAISALLAVSVLACTESSLPKASAGQAGSLTAQQNELKAAAEILVELTETVDPFTNQAAQSRVLDALKGASCGGSWLVPRPSFDTEYKRRLNATDLGQGFSDVRMAELDADGLRLKLEGLALDAAGKPKSPQLEKEIGEGVERLAITTVKLMVLRLDVTTRSGQSYIGTLAAQQIKDQSCLTKPLREALDAVEVTRNQVMIELIASGAASRALAGANVRSLLASRAAFQKAFDAAILGSADSEKAIAHVREIAKQVDTAQLLKSRTELTRALRNAK